MAECITPFTVKSKITNESIAVPCGKCPACFARRVSQWSFRLMQEDRQSISSQFITLTYDTKYVPITANSYMQLDKTDVQKFIKRYRKRTAAGSRPLKYFCVGEYGGKSSRPHYHIIMFNVQLEHIQDAWGRGSVHYGTVTGASIGYTLKYMSKRARIPMHKNDDRQPEFSLMSKGLGSNYINQKIIDWHLKDPHNRMYLNLTDGKKIGMPRYYKEKIYQNESLRKAIGYHTRQKVLKEKEKQMAKDPNYYSNKFESDKASFRKMDKNSKKLENNKI